ncbi:type I polyketide synthase [Streptomyces corynorhini]|uniref:SDR family NAD(P)-dependent oxidoreductase n=1 Tax=Streptomyces corynorhini TaxID=2282652 RepID=A0A370BDJ8_9ACTN|nr:type I polyketide synthase [Streptomyces corynorhini]RDG39830.1 SDR family NAD(P)-dependent oxidoreductase [Streptomyces corynorhini]
MQVDINPAAAARNAARQPSLGPALIYEDVEIGYPALADRAGRLAEVLAAAGVTAGARVAHLGLNSPALLETYLACAWLGAVFVPVNHGLDAAGVGSVLRDCGARALVAEPGHRAVADAAGVTGQLRCLLVDDDPAAPLDRPADPHWTALSGALAEVAGPVREPVPLQAHHLALLLYTSGTTGRAKGVRLTHGNVWWNSANLERAAGVRPGDVNLVVTPLFHIGALGCHTLRSLARGGTTVIRRRFDPDRALRDLVELRINTMFAIPSLYAAIARAPGFAEADLSRLHTPIVSGAPVPPALVESYARRGVPLQQAWGLTETSCYATYLPTASATGRADSAGRAMPFTDVRLTDPASGLPVTEPGVRGEVCVRGPNVTAGYWNDPKATDEAFDADGWFRSGDIGCLDDEGFLSIVDRLKNMIISNGENIYPAEVEPVLADSPELADVAVLGVEHATQGEAVAAVAVAAEGAEPTVESVRAFAAARLVRYKLPVSLHLVDAIPRNAAGKIDRPALRRSVGGGATSGTDGRQERTRDPDRDPDRDRDRELSEGRERPAPVGERAGYALELVEWATERALGRLPAGLRTGAGFADMGVDSLAAVRVRDLLGEATGSALPATLLYDRPTPAAVAAHLESLLSGVEPAAVPVPAAPAPSVAADPVVIVGMGVRAPGGVSDAEELWRLLIEERDAVSGFPQDRGWDLEGLFAPAQETDPDADRVIDRGTDRGIDPGTDPAAAQDTGARSLTRSGGFLHDAALFDAEFFGISPREALAMDPQQRLLLETSWEAVEHAGIDPVSLKGRDVGVYTGLFANGYAGQVPARADLDGYRASGGATGVAAGRVAYVLGLHGPAVAVDTSCSSSLVALHLAVRALRAGECSMALAGGATVMANTEPFVEFSRQRGLAPDGRCKSFADAADGTAWSEAVGVLVLERLSDARRHGRRVLAVIRGSAVNQDGASNGLTAPSGPAQQQVIRRALADAGLSPGDVDAVEAHGTGTVLGDPIEAQALQAVYGPDRAHPLLLGSVKSNLGHTQAAAGVIGVVKTVLALEHGLLPRTLHVDRPTQEVDWSSGAVRLLTEPCPWPAAGRPRRAAVSSFGMSGTNGHVILEQAPAGTPDSAGRPDFAGPAADPDALVPDVPVPVADVPVPVVVSAKSPQALAELSGRLAERLETGISPADLAHTLAARTPWEHRAVLTGDAGQLSRGLRALASGRPDPRTVTGAAAPGGPTGRTVFVFPGQGAQWAGMGRELGLREPVFAARMAQCARALAPHTDWSLAEVVAGAPGAPSLDRVDVVQPLSFAVMVSLAALWQECGVRPDAVLGHSQGEIAAACVAGALSLPDAARVVALRSRAIAARLAGRGGMLSVLQPEHRVRELLRPWQGRVEVAAVNGPAAVVLAGEPGALTDVQLELESRGAQVRLVPVDYASHAPGVEAVRDGWAELLGGIVPVAPEVPWYSTVEGEWMRGPAADGDYWYRNLRRPVRFDPAVRALAAQGFEVFVEVSSHPVLTAAVQDILADTGRPGVVCGTLRRDEGGPERFARSLGELFARGVPVDWAPLLPVGGRPVALPAHPFLRRRFWPARQPSSALAAAGLEPLGHPLLGAEVADPRDGGVLLTGRLSREEQPWLADHAVGGSVLLPGTALVEMALRAGERVGCPELEELVAQAPVRLDGALTVQVRVGGADERGRREVTVHTRPREADAPWTRHAVGRLAEAGSGALSGVGAGSGAGAEASAWSGAWPPEGARPVDVAAFYDALADRGYDYGPAFRCLTAAWTRGPEVFGEVALPEPADADGFAVHPALFDAAVHTALVAGPDGEPVLPFAWNGVRLHATGASSARVRVTPGPGALTVDVAAADGSPLLDVRSLSTRPLPPDPGAAQDGVDGALSRLTWSVLPASGAVPASVPVTVFGADPGAADGEDTPHWRVLPPGTGRSGLPEPERARQAVHRVLTALQSLLADRERPGARLVVATRRAVAVHDGDPVDPVAAAVWGLVRSAQTEHPGRFVLADLDTAPGPGSDTGPGPDTGPESGAASGVWTDAVGAVLAAVDEAGEAQCAVRGGQPYVPRLVRVNAAESAGGTAEETTGGTARPLDPEGTVLITGGTGMAGAVAARHAVTAYGARNVVLASRRGPAAPGAAELRRELAGLGARVETVACDVADREQVRTLLARIPREAPLTAVVHTAGVLDDGMIDTLDADRLAAVFGPKADGAVWLDELTRTSDPAVFVLFSSVAGVLGTAGQGNYAAASAFLDAVAIRRRAAGHASVSLAWGHWERAGGMTGHLGEADLARIGRTGMRPISDAHGMRLLDAGLASPHPVLVAAPVDRAVLRQRARDGALPRVLLPLAGRVGRTLPAARRALRLDGLDPAARRGVLLDLVRDEAAAVLGHSSGDRIDPAQPFKTAGFDSLTAVELRNRLTTATGARLPATLVFDFPTPADAAAFLHDELVPDLPAPGLAELDRLERALCVAPDEGTGRQIAARLRGLLTRIEHPPSTAAEDAAPDGLRFADDDELFAFIDTNL